MTARLAQTTDFSFVEELLSFGESYVPHPGDTVEHDAMATTEGEQVPGGSVTVVEADDDEVSLKDAAGKVYSVARDAWLWVSESPHITGTWDKHLRRNDPDGVAFADDMVDPGLRDRLRADVRRLLEGPADYHPGSGTRVRDLVHPSLWPFVEGRSRLAKEVVDRTVDEEGGHDRFGRPFERSRYQWLPTPFAIAEDGTVKALSYINNLHDAETAQDLCALFGAALPLIESVVGYVEGTTFYREGDDDVEDESELPELDGPKVEPAPPVSLRGRELLVIPKIIEYRLGEGETHEGVWHVEGMSHEHIVATCVYVLDRDPALVGGRLEFKRSYTVEEAGRLFWSADQSRPAPMGALVDEGTIPLGGVETPADRLLVFPNSHIHKLAQLSLVPGAKEGKRQIIVFWVVDPNVRLPSTREVEPQQELIPREEALAIRLELMEERRRHKETLNVRVVNLCEH